MSYPFLRASKNTSDTLKDETVVQGFDFFFDPYHVLLSQTVQYRLDGKQTRDSSGLAAQFRSLVLRVWDIVPAVLEFRWHFLLPGSSWGQCAI